MKEQSMQTSVIETPSALQDGRSLSDELSSILTGLLGRSRDPLDDEIAKLARAISEATRGVESLLADMRSIATLLAPLIEERGGVRETPRPSMAAGPRLHAARLSTREGQVLTHLLGGKSNREISKELGISEKTVKNHLWKVYRKIGVRNRTQLFHHVLTT